MDRISEKKVVTVIFSLIALLFISILISISVGPSGINPFTTNANTKIVRDIIDFRIRRTLLASIVGASLATAGCAMQSLFRNPLADPYIIGVSSGASVGAAIAILIGLSTTGLMFSAFITSILTVYVVYKLGKDSTYSLLLAGVAMATFLSGLTSFLIYISGESMHEVVFWIMGGFWTAEWIKVEMAFFSAVIGIIILSLYSWRMNALLLGEEHALSVGIDLRKFKAVVIAASALLTASAVSVSGIIGFVGLIIPHSMRLILGYDNRILIPASMLFAASFMPLVDVVSRITVSGELPVGIITSLIGAPFFIYLLKRGGGFEAES